ncbi:MAG TPA: hypothetical protein VHZ56_10650 [Devosia sp.]|nr:hypothetical protein [Devosia sp.]
MKTAPTFVAVIALVAPLASPVLADAKADAWTNCSKQIIDNTDVSRDALKTFQLNKVGGGYEMTGQDEEHRTISCQAGPDGRVTWLHIG